MSSSEDEFLDASDVKEEFSYDEECCESGSHDYDDINDAEDNDSDSNENENENGSFFASSYPEELEYEDIGEPSTFNFNIHNGEPVYSVDFLQGTEFMITGSGDARSLLVDARGIEVLADLGVAGDSIISAKFYQGPGDDIFVASASMDGQVRVYVSHPEKGIELKCTFDGPGEGTECVWIDWHSRGPILIGGFSDGSVWMWNAQLCKVMNIFAGHLTTSTTTGAFTPDGKAIVVGSEEGVLLVLNPLSPDEVFTKISPQSHQETSLQDITCLSVHPVSGQVFMASDSTGHLRVYKCFMEQQPMPLKDLSLHHTGSIEGLGFHPLGNLSMSAGMDGYVIIYDATFSLRHGLELKKLFKDEIVDDNVNCENDDGFTMAKWMSALPNGSALPTNLSFGLLLGTAQGRILIIDGRSGEILRRLRGRPGRPVLDASVSCNGILGVSFDDGIISLYQL